MADSVSVADVVAPVETVQVATPETTNTDDGGKPNTSGDSSEAKANRFAFAQARENERLKKEIEALKTPKEAPKFDEETDPDGRKEQAYLARQEAKEEVSEYSKTLEARLEATEKRLQMDDFRKEVLSDTKEFDKLGIKVDADKAVNVLLDIEKNWGLTPRQITALAHLDDIMKMEVKKGMPAPWVGGKATPTWKQLSRDEIMDKTIADFRAWNGG